jgi:transcriptional regulator with XRE-family HTH domain
MNDGTTTIMPNDAGQDRSPADIRAVFSQNLKELMGASPNVSALCRELSLNRTQFNRYLAGESFPRPDILQKICLHFGLDERILLQPLSELKNEPSNAQTFYGLHEFLNMRPGNVPEHLFPCGFYVFRATTLSIPTHSSKASFMCIARMV